MKKYVLVWGTVLFAACLIAQQISVRNIQPSNKRGTGPYIQLGAGSTTTNHTAKFDASGNLVDAGFVTPASGPVGPAGIQGIQGIPGPVGATGAAGSGVSLSGIPANAVLYSNGAAIAGSISMVWDSSLNRVVMSGSSGDKSYLGENYVYSLLNGITGKTIWALAKITGGAILRMSDGSGSGGLDGNGAKILANSSDGTLKLTGKLTVGDGIDIGGSNITTVSGNGLNGEFDCGVAGFKRLKLDAGIVWGYVCN